MCYIPTFKILVEQIIYEVEGSIRLDILRTGLEPFSNLRSFQF